MKISSVITINCIMIAAGFICMYADHYMVAQTEQAVRASCKSRVAYDKSGSLYCVDDGFFVIKTATR